jgi:outer membrane lipoprotein SlyB
MPYSPFGPSAWRPLSLLAVLGLVAACSRSPAPVAVTAQPLPLAAPASAPDANGAAAVVATTTAAPAAEEPNPAAAPPTVAPVKPAAPAARKPVTRKPVTRKPTHHASGATVAAGSGATSTNTDAVSAAPPVAATASAPAPVCGNCGVISQIRTVEDPGQGTGVGAVAGGLAGLILGNQIGDGNGKTLAKIAGAAGGAYAGNRIEKRVRTHQHYEVVVKMDDGETRTVRLTQAPAMSSGAAVRVADGQLVAR